MTTTKSKEVLRIENWLKTVGIDASKSQDLIDKYGVENTYKLVQEALMRPHDMAKHLDGTKRSSKNTITYLLDNRLTPEQIASSTRVDVEKVKAAMPQEVVIEKVKSPEPALATVGSQTTETNTPQEQSSQETREETRSALIDQAEASMAPDTEKRNLIAESQGIRFTKRAEQRTPVVLPEGPVSKEDLLPQHTAMPSSRYTWEHAMADSTVLHSVPAEDFLAEAKNKFSQNEGRFNEPYFDCFGHPTIGIGMLITRRDDIQTSTILKNTSLASKEDEILTAANIVNDKNAYYMYNGEKINLYSSERDKDPNITKIPEGATIIIKDSKGNSVTVNRIQNAGAKIIAVNGTSIGGISNNEVDQLYRNRVQRDYNRVASAVPNFEKMPASVQYVAVHMSFYAPSTFTTRYTEIFGRDKSEEISPLELMEGIEKYYEGRKISSGSRSNIALAKAEATALNDFMWSQRKIIDALPIITPPLDMQIKPLVQEKLKLPPINRGAEMS